MANFVITGKAEQTDESSYTVQSTGEVVTKIRLTLNVPGMQDRLLCEMPLEVLPKPDILEQWEMEETWLVVSASTMRALGFTRSNARPGEKAVGALVIFQVTEVREATADERRALMEARKVSKLQAKQRRAARKAERDATKAHQPQKPKPWPAPGNTPVPEKPSCQFSLPYARAGVAMRKASAVASRTAMRGGGSRGI
jgi:hypothetical protein